MKKAYYASIGLALISGLTFVVGCTSADKKPVPPVVAPAVQPIVPVDEETTKQPPPPPEKVVAPVDTTNQTAPLPADAKVLLQQAVQNTFLSAKSYAATMTLNTEIMGANISSTFNIKKCDNILYQNGSVLGYYFETYSNSENKSIVEKDPMTQKWQRPPADRKNLMLAFEPMQRKLYLEHIKDASFKGEEKIGEKDCRMIEATVSAEDLQELIMNKKDMPFLDLVSFSFDKDKVCLKLWVGKDDGLFYKIYASLEGMLSMEMPAGFPGGNEKDKKDKNIKEEDESSEAPDKSEDNEETPSGKQMMEFKYEIEIMFSDYNKLKPIIIPPDAKKAMENLQDEKTPEDKDKNKPEEEKRQ